MPTLASRDLAALSREYEANEEAIAGQRIALKRLQRCLEGLRERKVHTAKRVKEKTLLLEARRKERLKAKDECGVLKQAIHEVEDETERQKGREKEIRNETQQYTDYLQKLKDHHKSLQLSIENQKREFEKKKLSDTQAIKEKEEELMRRRLDKKSLVANTKNDKNADKSRFRMIEKKQPNTPSAIICGERDSPSFPSTAPVPKGKENVLKISENPPPEAPSTDSHNTKTLFNNRADDTATSSTALHTNNSSSTTRHSSMSYVNFFSARPFNRSSATLSHHHHIQSPSAPSLHFPQQQGLETCGGVQEDAAEEGHGAGGNKFIYNEKEVETRRESMVTEEEKDIDASGGRHTLPGVKQESKTNNEAEDDKNGRGADNDGEESSEEEEEEDDEEEEEEEEEDFRERNTLIFNTLLNRNFLNSSSSPPSRKEQDNKGYFGRDREALWEVVRRRGSFEYPKRKLNHFRLSWRHAKSGVKPSITNQTPQNKTTCAESTGIGRNVSFDSVTLFYEACRDGDCSVLQRLIDEEGMREEDLSVQANTTPLHISVFAGNLAALELLVSRGFDLNRTDLDGWTPLHSAATCNDVRMCQLLVKHGACVLARARDGGELASELCDEIELGCEETRVYLRGIERELGVVNNGLVYGVVASGMEEEDGGKLLQYSVNDCLVVLERDDTVGGGGGEERRYGGGGREEEKGGGDTKNGWWLCLLEGTHGFVLCEHLALQPRVLPSIST